MKAKRVIAEKVHDRRSADLPINSSVAVVIVADPYSKDGEKIEVLRSIRNDPLGDMNSRGLLDDAQYLAGRKWQKLHECSTIGVIQAIDPAKEAVDGGVMRDFLTDRQIDAFKELQISYEALGSYGGKLVFQILGEGLSVSEASYRWGYSGAREINYFSRRFRECLETLAIHWGYAQPKRRAT
jgi:hypothetical protein